MAGSLRLPRRLDDAAVVVLVVAELDFDDPPPHAASAIAPATAVNTTATRRACRVVGASLLTNVPSLGPSGCRFRPRTQQDAPDRHLKCG
jgi:hypothetical protein